MKKLFYFILLPLSTFAQKMPDFGLNKIRLNGPEQTVVAEILPLKNDITIQNDKTYYWYSNNTIHTTQGGYSGRILNGLYSAFYLNKNLKEQGVFKKGLKDGAWKTWNENGKLAQQYSWKQGALSGTFSIYNDAGNLKQTGKYKDNLLEGRSAIYSGKDSGMVVNYRHGQIKRTPELTILQKLHLKKKKTDSTNFTAPHPVKNDGNGKMENHKKPS